MSTGVCCSRLEEPKALMKMGLGLVLVGHVNFLLGALVHGVVIRHISLDAGAQDMAYATSNVLALTAGLVGVVLGILAIILSKNKTRRALICSMSMVSLLAGLLAKASVVGLTVSMVRAVLHGGRNLLTHCRLTNDISNDTTHNCPFDPTHIYTTTLVLWVPLIVMCVVQLVFSARCFSASMSFLGLRCCSSQKIRPRDHDNMIAEPSVPAPSTPCPPPLPREPSTLPRFISRHPPAQLHSDPSHLKSQRQHLRPPLHPQYRGKPETRLDRSQLKSPEEHELLQQSSQWRSSFWV
ncbi:hypothetical protein UPYG_G00331340 [Umbra pygmaea]|uniref:Keratinocyte-associated protein 3 n=1 Tax=Umbra pygmaea TaxID=75934 RepID=A0ABD0VVU7_UMBPY